MNSFLKGVQYIFITTHSTQIASAVSLDEIICLHSNGNNLYVGYPGKVFTDIEEDKKSKAYVQRFLDATKSDMLFARKIIFVEGIAEELLIPTFAKYLKKSLEDNHVAIINVGGRYFNHFVKLFDTLRVHAIPKKIVCITDRDPSRREKGLGGNYTKCYPYEYNLDSKKYDYKENATENINKFSTHQTIHFFSQEEKYGKTFEYELIINNPNLEILVTDSMSNRNEIIELMGLDYNEGLSKLRSNDENNRIKESLSASTLNEDDKKKALIASRYLNSISKGGNALELCTVLEENLMRKEEDRVNFNIPLYIKDAIEWLLK